MPTFLELADQAPRDWAAGVEGAALTSLLAGEWTRTRVVNDMQSCVPDEPAQQPVLGLALARNRTVDVATAEFFALIDDAVVEADGRRASNERSQRIPGS